MEVIAHHDVTQQLPVATADRLFEHLDQPASVRIIADDFLPRIAPRHHVINGAFLFDPKSSWHVTSLDASEIICQAENKTQSLTPRAA